MTTDKYLLVDALPTIEFHAYPRVGMFSKNLMNAFVYYWIVHNQILPLCIGISPLGFMGIKVQVFFSRGHELR